MGSIPNLIFSIALKRGSPAVEAIRGAKTKRRVSEQQLHGSQVAETGQDFF